MNAENGARETQQPTSPGNADCSSLERHSEPVKLSQISGTLCDIRCDILNAGESPPDESNGLSARTLFDRTPEQCVRPPQEVGEATGLALSRVGTSATGCPDC